MSNRQFFALAAILSWSAAAQGQNWMFWTDGLAGPNIHRAAWDGSGPVDVFPPNALAYPSPPEGPWLESVVVDPVAEKIYWLGIYPSNTRIERSNFDGSDRELLHTAAGWAQITDIVIDSNAQRMYWNATSGILSADLDGNDIQTVISGAFGGRGIAASFEHGWLFFITNNEIKRCRVDGSGLQTIVADTGQTPYAIEADPNLQRIFWTAIGTGKICSANFDGSHVMTLVTGANAPTGLAIDGTHFKMYWCEFSGGKIRRANLDGTQVQDLAIVYGPIGFALDIGTRNPEVPAISPRMRFLAWMIIALLGAASILTPARRGA